MISLKEMERHDYLNFFGEHFLSQLTGQKGMELFAVYNYAVNEGQSGRREDFITNPDEPADIEYQGRKFQVVSGSPDQQAVLGMLKNKDIAESGNVRGKHWMVLGDRVRAYEAITSYEHEVEVQIINPIRKKMKRYGEGSAATQDVTLLIYVYSGTTYPYEDKDILSIQSAQETLFLSSGFSDIYLSDHNRNIHIFHRN